VTAVTLWDLSTTTFAVTGSVAGERVDVDENQVDGMLWLRFRNAVRLKRVAVAEKKWTKQRRAR
jgi:hypothetical protein